MRNKAKHWYAAVRMRLIYMFTILICDYYGLNADAANLSFHWLSTINYYRAIHYITNNIALSATLLHSLLSWHAALHLSLLTALHRISAILSMLVAKNLREPQLIIAAPPRWSKPRELFLPPVSPSSLCRICFTGDSAPLRRWSARKLDKTRWTR